MSHPWRPTPAGPFTAVQLAKALGLEAPAHDSQPLTTVKPLLEAEPTHLSFLDNPSYAPQAAQTKAGAVLIHPNQAALLPAGCIALVTKQPYVDLARALALFYPAQATSGIHPTAVLGAGAQVHPTAQIGPFAVLGAGVQVGAGTVIGAHCVLQKCTVGEGCLLHPGVKIGQDGFGFAQSITPTGLTLTKVPQVGGVIIGNHVEIGANTTIDCGALADTVIEDHVKIDNQVQIGHNAHIGTATRIVAQVGVAGSTHVGAFNVIGGQSGLAGHLTTAMGVQVAARSGVTKSISTPQAVVAGTPAVPIAQWRRAMASLSRLAKAKGQKGDV